MYRSHPTLTQTATSFASGVWADTCLESSIAGQLELPHRHPVSPTTQTHSDVS